MYADIIEATKNFDNQYCIGEGSLGKVYKAATRGGVVFAVKNLQCDEDNLDIESIKAFQSEVETKSEMCHRNIVKLYGFCSQGLHTFLFSEYMDIGDLADMLKNEALMLDWPKRVCSIKGVANALSYMHHDCALPLIHRDISSKNILLTSNFEAHVSDFGTARFLKPDSPIWTSFASTYELAHNERINFKEILDPHLSFPSKQNVLKEMALIANLALSCLQTNPQSRPTMRSIAQLYEMETADNTC